MTAHRPFHQDNTRITCHQLAQFAHVVRLCLRPADLDDQPRFAGSGKSLLEGPHKPHRVFPFHRAGGVKDKQEDGFPRLQPVHLPWHRFKWLNPQGLRHVDDRNGQHFAQGFPDEAGWCPNFIKKGAVFDPGLGYVLQFPEPDPDTPDSLADGKARPPEQFLRFPQGRDHENTQTVFLKAQGFRTGVEHIRHGVRHIPQAHRATIPGG